MTHLAIIGAGPRGLAALESLCFAASVRNLSAPLSCVVFETTSWVGCGPVYATDQPPTNWLNVAERLIEIAPREACQIGDAKLPAFPSYHDWSDRQLPSGSATLSGDRLMAELDHFPDRAHLGRYLHQRFLSLSTVLQEAGHLQLVKTEVRRIEWIDGQFCIYHRPATNEPSNHGDDVVSKYSESADGDQRGFDEVVLTIGHQPTCPDDQIKRWLVHAAGSDLRHLFTKPYPVGDFVNHKSLVDTSVIAIRGFGLAMIDVTRALTCGKGGSFVMQDKSTQRVAYRKSGREPAKIVAFSLDGLPPAPKPLSADIDKHFKPTETAVYNAALLLKQLQQASHSNLATLSSSKLEPDTTFWQFKQIMADVIAEVFLSLGARSIAHTLSHAQIVELVSHWLKDGSTSHPLLASTENLPEYSMHAFVAMAIGTEPVSLDYCAGQVWRHLQPTLYSTFSHSPMSSGFIAQIISLDERMKRYAFGPPVASIQQLLALIDAGVLDLSVSNDPHITLALHGWTLESNKSEVPADVMIDSVLPAPDIKTIESPLVKQLLDNQLLKPVHDDLGVETQSDGLVVPADEDVSSPMSVLGRLAKGTLVGVDAILECFGSRIPQWADGVMERHVKRGAGSTEQR